MSEKYESKRFHVSYGSGHLRSPVIYLDVCFACGSIVGDRVTHDVVCGAYGYGPDDPSAGQATPEETTPAVLCPHGNDEEDCGSCNWEGHGR